MTKTQRLRMTIDITMTILSIILMGRNYLFPADIVHEILGVGLFFLWAIHIILNRRWYYLFMSLHIGLHVGASFRTLRQKSFPPFFSPSSALTAFTLSSPAESGNILFSSSSFSSSTQNAATFFLQSIIFLLSFCLLHSRTFGKEFEKRNWTAARFQARTPLKGSTVKFEGALLLSAFSPQRILI